MQKYTRRPEQVHAIEWTGDNLEAFKAAFPGREFIQRKNDLEIRGMGQKEKVSKGDYVVQSAEGIVYRTSKSFFLDKYEVAG